MATSIESIGREVIMPGTPEILRFLERLEKVFKNRKKAEYVMVETCAPMPWIKTYAWISSDYAVSDPKDMPESTDVFYVVVCNSGPIQFDVLFECASEFDRLVLLNRGSDGVWKKLVKGIVVPGSGPLPMEGFSKIKISQDVESYTDILKIGSKVMESGGAENLDERVNQVLFRFHPTSPPSTTPGRDPVK